MRANFTVIYFQSSLMNIAVQQWSSRAIFFPLWTKHKHTTHAWFQLTIFTLKHPCLLSPVWSNEHKEQTCPLWLELVFAVDSFHSDYNLRLHPNPVTPSVQFSLTPLCLTATRAQCFPRKCLPVRSAGILLSLNSQPRVTKCQPGLFAVLWLYM